MNTALVLLTLVATPSDDAVPYIEGALVAWTDGRTDAAVGALEVAIEIDPQNVDALAALAYMWFMRGNMNMTIDYLRRVLEFDPTNDAARLLLARAWYALGRQHRGDETLDVVLERHPALQSALELRSARYAELTPLTIRASVGMAGVYDSNLSLDPGILEDVSNRHAGLLELEGAVALSYTRLWIPVTVLAWFDSFTPLVRSDLLSGLAPTTVGAGLIGQHAFGRIETRIDLRYEELFTELFENHLQRTLAPSAFVAFPLSTRNRLRVSVGAELRMPEPDFARDNSTTLKAALRDEISLGRWMFLFDVGGRLNTGADWQPGEWRRTNYTEIDASLYGEYHITSDVTALAAAVAQGRRFESGPDEYTLGGIAGGRINLGAIELHAEYGFTTNQSGKARTFARHRAVVGVRAFYD